MDRIRRAIDLMQQSVDKHLSLDLISSEVGVSKHHFIRRFKAVTGLTPMQYLAAARVECAKRKLRSTGMTLALIAFSCGFASQAHMTTAFKRATGTTPARYRRLNRSESLQELLPDRGRRPPGEPR